MPFNSDAELLLFLEDDISLLTFSSIVFVLSKKFSLYSFPFSFPLEFYHMKVNISMYTQLQYSSDWDISESCGIVSI